jgi:hypothetical protein
MPAARCISRVLRVAALFAPELDFSFDGTINLPLNGKPGVVF